MFTSSKLPPRVLVWDDLILEMQDLLRDHPSPIYLVGGVVRDAFMRRPMKDIDIATPESGITLGRRIANLLRADFYPLDAERGVGRVLVAAPQGQVIIDVAQFRAADLEHDLFDRDFTINAMAVDLRGDLNEVIDPTGGEQDLIGRMLRRCHPDSIAHDPIRALRGVRQSVKFGFRINPETLQDMRRAAPDITKTSPERVRDELFNLLDLDKPDTALRVCDALGLLSAVLPEAALLHQRPGKAALKDGFALAMNTVEQLNRILTAISPHRTDETAAQFSLGMLVMATDRYRRQLRAHIDTIYPNERTHRALLFLGVLLGYSDTETVEERAHALRLSNAERERLIAVQRHRGRLEQVLGDELHPLLIYRYWRDTQDAGVDVILMTLARTLSDQGIQLDQDAWLRTVDYAGVLLNAWFERRPELVDPPPLVDGRQLMAHLQLKSGRIIGELLERIREAQVTGEIATTAEALSFAARSMQPPEA